MNMEEAAKAWAQEFEKLPQERQESLKKWYGVQAYTAKELGLELEEWMQYVQWAFSHPLDYSFIADFPELANALSSGDGFERGASKSSASLIGGTEPTFTAPEKPKKGSSVFDLMLGGGADKK
mgnify:CR=1 FL=1